MQLWYYAACIAVCIVLSAFFSASEMAYSSAGRLRLESATEAGSKRAACACSIIDKYDHSLSAILIANNFVNIAAASAASVFAIVAAGEAYTPLAAAVVVLLIIVFGEAIPKITAKKNANRYAISFAFAVRALTVVLKPLTIIAVGAVKLIMGSLKDAETRPDREAAVEELQSIIETVEDEGVIDVDRSELLQAALDFSEVSVSEIMTSRVDMVAIDIGDPEDAIALAVDNASYSRIPVYEDSVDRIIGILYLNRYFKALTENEKPDIRGLLIEPCYVYKTIKLPAVLGELKRAKTHIAVVTDEYGGSMGIVTMEDVLEQIVGEIWDETDEIVHDVIKAPDGSCEIDGDMSIPSFLELIQYDEAGFETGSSTVGGWTIEMFGGFPEPGQSFVFGNMTVTVTAMDGLRVDSIRADFERPLEKDG
ncbi:MAG: hemolysin family protein [Oscillospiraceae bacterium]|nr:hemolysin family protein [Oscillospiraceae bacterium]